MAESRLVPSNLMTWPRVRDLLPDQKLIVYHLWATSASSAGCNLVDVHGLSAHLSLASPALEEALGEFQRRGLVQIDKETGEVFIADWFRFHKFAPGARFRLLQQDVEKIASERLRGLVKDAARRHGVALTDQDDGDYPIDFVPTYG